MLVLSRREKEKVLFPALGISVEVVRTGSKKVQLGIDAPREIRVIREELEELSCDVPSIPSADICEVAIRSALNSASSSIQTAKRQIRNGLNERANRSLQLALKQLDRLEQSISNNRIDCNRGAGIAREKHARYQISAQSIDVIVCECFSSHF